MGVHYVKILTKKKITITTTTISKLISLYTFKKINKKKKFIHKNFKSLTITMMSINSARLTQQISLFRTYVKK